MAVQLDINKLFVELVGKNFVACGETRQLPGATNMWRIDCQLFKPGNKERAKEGLTEFLILAWKAEDIKFTIGKHHKNGHFYCTFRSEVY